MLHLFFFQKRELKLQIDRFITPFIILEKKGIKTPSRSIYNSIYFSFKKGSRNSKSIVLNKLALLIEYYFFECRLV